jgi:hypothetical protein
MIHGCEQGNSLRIKMNMSQSVLVSLIIRCIMKPHVASLCQLGNLERVILAAYENNENN